MYVCFFSSFYKSKLRNKFFENPKRGLLYCMKTIGFTRSFMIFCEFYFFLFIQKKNYFKGILSYINVYVNVCQIKYECFKSLSAFNLYIIYKFLKT